MGCDVGMMQHDGKLVELAGALLNHHKYLEALLTAPPVKRASSPVTAKSDRGPILRDRRALPLRQVARSNRTTLRHHPVAQCSVAYRAEPELRQPVVDLRERPLGRIPAKELPACSCRCN